jgi:hypothetical protein
VSESARFVPTEFDPPTSFMAGDFRLEPLGPQHNEHDYAAWTSSMEHIRRSPGFPDGNWPREMSLDDNRGDLERHARDFVDRRGFTFTVLDSTDDVVGCVYVYPAHDGVHDANVQSWVRESEAALDDALRRAIADWLTSDAWPFERPHYAPLLTWRRSPIMRDVAPPPSTSPSMPRSMSPSATRAGCSSVLPVDQDMRSR